MGLADGVIEAAQGRRARAPRAHRCTGRSRTTPSAHSATFFGSCKMPNSSILPRGKASAGAKAAATRAAPLVLPSPPPQPTRRGSAKPRARVGRQTRGPAYPDIDIGASQTDSALMRGAAAGEGPARPRRCRCPRVKRVRLSTKISRPQGGVKRLLFGCERPKNECFTCPTMGQGTRL